MNTPKKHEVFNLDGTTQLEFLDTTKTVHVIDKEKFFACKQLMNNNADDIEIAEYLNIAEDKVQYFKYRMQQFEDQIRSRRRAVKVTKKKKVEKPTRKREMSSEERFRRARDLIAQNYSTNQISKILKISERSVTRFKRRMREERKRLKSEGRIPINSEDDDDKFKHLKPEEKIRKAHELFKKNLKIPEIAEILKISERSVRRWKDRLEKYKDCDFDIAQECQEEDAPYEFEEIEEQSPPRKKKKFTVDREKVEYARELIENKLSNKDMSLLLEMSIACVRKLKTKILNGSVEELIDNNEEYYRNLELMNSGDIIDPENDPLQSTETYFTGKSTIPIKPERKPKVLLRERDGKIARLLRDNNVRTMDIAKMMNISERSVTRLLAKFRDVVVMEYEHDVVTEVDKMLAEKDILLSSDVCIQEQVDYLEDEIIEEEQTRPQSPQSQFNLCSSLLSMNVQVKDISKMLDISEKQVIKWKHQLENQDQEMNEFDDEDD